MSQHEKGRAGRTISSSTDPVSTEEVLTPAPPRSCGCAGPCGGLRRREFLKVAAGAATAMVPAAVTSTLLPLGLARSAKGQQPADGGDEVQHFVPADKGLRSEWIRGLFERGTPEVYRSADLATLAMPVGGIAAGQLYLLGDGTLAGWQIFNKVAFSGLGVENYQHRQPDKPVNQGFALVIEDGGEPTVRPLSIDGFPDVAFASTHPIARVHYPHGDCPLDIELEAFSPFIPLNARDSAMPATVFHITVSNPSDRPVKAGLLGWLENAVCLHSGEYLDGRRVGRIVRERDRTFILHTAEPLPPGTRPTPRSPILLADFEGETYGDWTVEGTAFGQGPAKGTFPTQQQVTGFEGQGLVNTYAGNDDLQGSLTSPPFEINRRFLNFLIGGGQHPGKACLNLLVDGQVVRSATGENNEQLKWRAWNVEDFAGKQGVIQILDHGTGGWGHINVDHIELADEARVAPDGRLETMGDFGSLCLAFAGEAATGAQAARLAQTASDLAGKLTFDEQFAAGLRESHTSALATPLATLEPKGQRTYTFVLAWHFPNRKTMDQRSDQMYANWYADAAAVAHDVLDRIDQLTADTRLWRDTYYDSTLPYWLLNRLHSTVANLATNTCEWWKNGRFWAWEGVYCCAGTCTHVWNYAHALARLFPELERSAREMQDLGSALRADGLVGFRGEHGMNYAADGQAGTVLKCYREHLTSPDDGFLKRNWLRIKSALEFLIRQDDNEDGLIENSQHNTYDINFAGPNTFVGSLYLAALRAGEEMARAIGDAAFAQRARRIYESGRRLTVERLWNGEYFIQDVDLEKHPQHQYGQGCLSDQLFGEGWARQVALGDIYPRERVAMALQSIWKYNWAPDIGPQIAAHAPWRHFTHAGEPGLFVCTWPKSRHLDKGVAYQNEVWTGIEYQVAGHMIWDGLLTEGLAICRAVHDRYHPGRHNLYNEVECGDHYARALASWGVFIALAGFDYHGPNQHIGFAPRLAPENFKTAFTAAEGWGSFAQRHESTGLHARLDLRWGRLALRTIALDTPTPLDPPKLTVTLKDQPIAATAATEGRRVTITLATPVVLRAGEVLELRVS